ncbi:MAG: transcription termination/antitermination protein NusA [Ruminiclostridium sp.]|nr:transcription termination/antitermination protein NusA [Ruminiclostridium sp.]
MAKKTPKNAKSNELDGKEFFAAIDLIEKEKGIPKSYMLEKITQALVSAYKRDHEGITDNVFIDANEEAGTVRMYVKKEIVEDVGNVHTEISLEEAQKTLPSAQVGDVVRIEIKPRNFGRIAAQTARQVIIQGMREAEHSIIYDTFTSKEHEMLMGVVTRIDPQSGKATVRISSNGETADATMTVGEQIRGENVREGDRVKVYLVEVRRTNRGPQLLVSRTHPGLVKRLFELEVPEIYDGTVEIRSIAREAGSRSKIAVWSADENVDPIGACVGPKGTRVNNVVAELRSEKIDIIKYSDDPAEFVAASLSPADVISVQPIEGTKNCRVLVPDDQLSLAIGKEGQNARLAAKLTGYKIDIKAESAAHEWDEEDATAAEEMAAAALQRAAEEMAQAQAAASSLENSILAAFGMSSYEEAMRVLAEDEAEEAAAAAAAAEAEAAEPAEQE